MDYPFISKNDQPIVPGQTITYRSRRYGRVYAEVWECRLTRKNNGIVNGKRVYKTAIRISVRVTSAEKKQLLHGYSTVINPKTAFAII